MHLLRKVKATKHEISAASHSHRREVMWGRSGSLPVTPEVDCHLGLPGKCIQSRRKEEKKKRKKKTPLDYAYSVASLSLSMLQYSIPASMLRSKTRNYYKTNKQNPSLLRTGKERSTRDSERHRKSGTEL